METITTVTGTVIEGSSLPSNTITTTGTTITGSDSISFTIPSYLLNNNSDNTNYRSIPGEIKVLAKKNEFLYEVELWLLNDKVNRNNWKYVNLSQHVSEFNGIPILVAYINGGTGVGDGHNFTVTIDPKTGEEVPSFTDAEAERIVGALSDSAGDISLVERDGNTWVVGKGYLWRWYARELVDKIEQDALQGRSMSISIETLVTKSHMDGDVEVEEAYKVLGVTILGDHVRPAVADARIVALQELGSEFKELKLRAASYQKSQQESKEKGVKKNMDVFSKKQVADLAASFDGYNVLGAMQDDSGIHVCLMSADGATSIYTMGSLSEAVVPGKIAKVNAKAVFSFGEDCTVVLDACELTDGFAAELVKVNSSLEQVNKELEDCKATIKTMQEAEAKRRVEAAVEAAKRQLSEINKNRVEAERFDEALISDILADAEKGCFSEICNAEGAWTGAERVMSMVRDAAMQKQMAMDAERASKTAKKSYIFEQQYNGSEANASSVESIYASIVD